MRVRVLPQLVVLGTLLAAVGCHFQVDKGPNGENKNVKIDTPLGGLHVRADQTAASDLGLPVYPGAQVAPGHDGDKSADVHLGFGQFQLRVKVVTYETPDQRDKVIAFYKNAMGRFGDVITCDGDSPVAVSYTHLDVYKRQPQQPSGNRLFTRLPQRDRAQQQRLRLV